MTTAPAGSVSAAPLAGQLPFGPPNTLDRALSRLVRGMSGSEILRIGAEVRQLSASGRPVCNLTVGDFDPRQFPIPAELLAAIHEALAAGETNYPPSDGVMALRQAVADRFARDQGVRFPVESVLIAGGVRPLLYAAFRTVVDPGDAVVFGVPSWNTEHYCWLTGSRAVPVQTARARGFHPALDDLAPHLGTASLVCLCSPANPTGTMIDPDELGRITAAVVAENQVRSGAGRRPLFLIYDQVYGSLVQGVEHHSHPLELVPEAAPWTISLDGISKAFAATGLRVGWSLAAPAVTARMRDLIGHIGAWAPRPEQVAVATFLRDEVAIRCFREAMDRGLALRFDALCDGFQALRNQGYPVDWVRPQGAIYLSLRLDLVGRSFEGRPLKTNDDIRRLLLEEAGLAVVPFQAFGVPEDTGWFRLSVGAVSPSDIGQAFPRLRHLLDRLE